MDVYKWIGILCVLFIIMLFCREVACWYWKINHISGLLEDIKELLKEQQPIKTKSTQTKKAENDHPDILDTEDEQGTFFNYGTGK